MRFGDDSAVNWPFLWTMSLGSTIKFWISLVVDDIYRHYIFSYPILSYGDQLSEPQLVFEGGRERDLFKHLRNLSF
jgi:hypothetical protein